MADSIKAPRAASGQVYGEVAGTLVLTSMMSFPRSFAPEKIVLIGVFIAIQMVRLLGNEAVSSRINVKNISVFYLIVAFLGVTWSAVGAHNGGYPEAIPDYLRLYVIWSGAFFLLLISLRQSNCMLMLHRAVIYSGCVISIVNAFGIFDYYYGIETITENIKAQLELRVGFHDGYMQVTSHNIGFLLFICGYLIAWYCRADARAEHPVLGRVSLLLSLAIVVASGRRALWLVVLLAPVIVMGVSIVTRTFGANRRLGRLVAIALGSTILVPLFVPLGDTLDFVRSAFSSDDERTIQSSFLIDGFKQFPFFGSGFGVNAGYTRSAESPWLYELTYHQLLFNFGLVGCAVIALTAAAYFRIATSAIMRSVIPEPGAFELLVGLLTFLVGTYSNPYLGSFDFSLTLAMLPLVASYSLEDRRLAARLSAVEASRPSSKAGRSYPPVHNARLSDGCGR